MQLHTLEAYYNLGVSYAEMHKYDKAGLVKEPAVLEEGLL